MAIEKSQEEIGTKKPKLLADDEADVDSTELPVWLVMTAKKHIIDKARLYVGRRIYILRSEALTNPSQKARQNVRRSPTPSDHISV